MIAAAASRVGCEISSACNMFIPEFVEVVGSNMSCGMATLRLGTQLYFNGCQGVFFFQLLQ